MSASDAKKSKKRRTKKGLVPSQSAACKLVQQELVEASSDSESAVDATYNTVNILSKSWKYQLSYKVSSLVVVYGRFALEPRTVRKKCVEFRR